MGNFCEIGFIKIYTEIHLTPDLWCVGETIDKMILFVIFFILATHSQVFSFLISLFFISPCPCLLFLRAYFPSLHPQMWQCSISCRKITCQRESERDRERFEGKRCKCHGGRNRERRLFFINMFVLLQDRQPKRYVTNS